MRKNDVFYWFEIGVATRDLAAICTSKTDYRLICVLWGVLGYTVAREGFPVLKKNMSFCRGLELVLFGHVSCILRSVIEY